LQLQYKDAAGWITVPDTGIDYPFAHTVDNSFYLNKDISGKYAAAGTVFMDCRNSGDFTDFNTILYGHHMKNGSMFGSLKKFGGREFFEANRTGTVFLPDKTYNVEFFAYMVVRSDDDVAYGILPETGEKQFYLDYIKENAERYRDIGVSPADKIIALSTCSYEFKDARIILAGKLSLLYSN
ncbi:MAG: class B sortase, partial [Oscillospiraceae bacterium]|nr:class B sortase [Oscillospiraceae bacterium]